ncbi:MAG: DUF2062 domain-containing protein [Cytophagaceae bacterium]
MIKEKIYQPLLRYLKQGMSPDKLALTVALGIVISSFPIIGPTTLMCFIAAYIFKLNIGALQLVNYLAYPVQILCIIPQYKGGAMMFGKADFQLSQSELLALFKESFSVIFEKLLWASVHAMGFWLICAPFVVFIIFFVLKPVFIKVVKRLEINKASADDSLAI